jgi:5'-nucleotidase
VTRTLITNDDGIDAPGLHRLALAAVKAGMDVVVAAPAREASGASASLTAVEDNRRVVVSERQLPDLDGIPAYAVAGSPGFITLIATRGAFGEPPVLVLSGINRGANAGYAVLHSGTVGAALTGAANGCRGLAVSLDLLAGGRPLPVGAAVSEGRADESRNWDAAAALAARLLPMLEQSPSATVLNVNVPDLPTAEIRGLRRATLSRFGQVQMAIAEMGAGFVRTTIDETDAELEADSDIALLAERYATITPLCLVSEAAIDLPGLADIFADAREATPAP